MDSRETFAAQAPAPPEPEPAPRPEPEPAPEPAPIPFRSYDLVAETGRFDGLKGA